MGLLLNWGMYGHGCFRAIGLVPFVVSNFLNKAGGLGCPFVMMMIAMFWGSTFA